MDPNACWQRLVDAIACGDVSEAKDAHYDLRTWIARGGFEPDWKPPMTRETFVSMWGGVVVDLKCNCNLLGSRECELHGPRE